MFIKDMFMKYELQYYYDYDETLPVSGDKL